MQRALIVLILLIAGIGVYLFTQKSDSLNDVKSQQSLEPANQEIEPTVVEAAKQHIEKLTTESKEQVLDITKADNFVTGEQLLKMPTMESEQITIEKVDSTYSAGTTETAESSVQTTQTQAIKQKVEQMVETVVENRAATAPAKTSTAQTNQVEPAAQSSDEATQLVVTQTVDSGSKVIQGAAAAIQTQSVVVTQGAAPAVSFEPTQVDATNLEVTKVGKTQTGQSLQPGQRIRLQELLSDPDLAAGTVFYIHAVSPTDAQGLWGRDRKSVV